MNATRYLQRTQHGFVLVSAILLLLVMSILAVSMFRSFGMQEKIAGNVREKQRAVQAAGAAELYAEAWLRDNAKTAPVQCTAGLISAALVSTIPICSNSIQDITSNPATKTPWKAGTADVGVEYFPGDQNGGAVGRMTTSSTTYPDTVYAAAPRFHIQDFGPSPVAGQGEIYQIDAVGFGGTASAVAVVRSTFSVYTDSWDPSK